MSVKFWIDIDWMTLKNPSLGIFISERWKTKNIVPPKGL